MPEYTQIQLSIKYDTKTFRDTLNTARDMYSELGIDKTFLNSWIKNITWNVEENGFVYAGCNANSINVKLFDSNIDLHIRPLIMGYVYSESNAKINIELLFLTEEIYDFSLYKYKKDSGQILWECMKIFNKHFNNVPVFLTNEIDDDLSLNATHSNQVCDDLYKFDLAIIPSEYKFLYKQLPREYNEINNNELIKIININEWANIPID